MTTVFNAMKIQRRSEIFCNSLLIAACGLGSLTITNERGLFVPIPLSESALVNDISTMFTQSRLLSDSFVNDLVSPLAPFEVTADSRDLRRRLMDALNSNDQLVSNPTPSISEQVLRLPTTLPSSAINSPTSVATSTITTVPSPTVTSTPSEIKNTLLPQNSDKVVSIANVDPTLQSIVPQAPNNGVTAIPETSTWVCFIMGFLAVGAWLRMFRRGSENPSF